LVYGLSDRLRIHDEEDLKHHFDTLRGTNVVQLQGILDDPNTRRLLDNTYLIREAYIKLHPDAVTNPKLEKKVGSVLFNRLATYGLTDEQQIRDANDIVQARQARTDADIMEKTVLGQAVRALDLHR